MSVPEVIMVVTGSSVVSAMLVLLFGYFRTGAMPDPALTRLRLSRPDDEVAYLFDGRNLVDATPAARSMLPRSGRDVDDWGEFILGFGDRICDLESRLERLSDNGTIALDVTDDQGQALSLEAERSGDLLRIALKEPAVADGSELVERYTTMAMRAELATLRSVAEASPTPTWKKRHDGTITWANAAYMSLNQGEPGFSASVSWPPPDIFASITVPDQEEPFSKRVSVVLPGKEDRSWFDLKVLSDGEGSLNFAQPIDALVRAETALSGFVQTLTKTFAHLTVGLAIFDKNRKLVLFNPALVELTGLPPEQLSARPTLHTFLDALRDRQRIPEPRDYKRWRMHIAQLESGAADGTYAQTWYLANGQTYRVTGRPHPDGAVAYVFEDITSQVSLTRSFRSEIKLSKSILDSLDDAVAIFTHSGALTMSNRAYGRLWNPDGTRPMDDVGLVDASAYWGSRCADADSLAAIKRGLLESPNRQSYEARIIGPGGLPMIFRLRPLADGALMVVFHRPDDRDIGHPPRLSRVGT